MKLAIYTCATAGYTYALKKQAHAVQAALSLVECDALILIVSEGNEEAESCAELYRQILPAAQVQHIIEPSLVDGHENYKKEAQLVIAKMRTIASVAARAWNADYCLALDSDVIPKANSIRCMIDLLAFDGGYYKVAACPYPSQGGGDFLCGRGTPQNQILPDFDESEKKVPKEMIANRDEARKAYMADTKNIELRDKLKEADDKIRDLPPKGNVFEMNAKQWRRRGWFSAAYPGIGKGAIVPSDWCGFGCTMMSREALALCDFSGYDGGGTEDLFICWNRWHPAGIKIGAIPHSPADHIIRDRSNPGKFIHCFSGHESDGECVGHLRQHQREWT